jgi:CubicO group peptidase (beta-lactamase class C family)
MNGVKPMNKKNDTKEKAFSKYLLLILLTLVCLTSCKEQIVDPPNTYKYKIPEQIEDGWKTADLSTVGINKQPIIDMVNSIHNDSYKNVHSVLIVRQDRLVFEEYFEGEKFKLAQYTGEMGFDRDDMHNLCSATKSFTLACIGIAMDQGLIQGVNQKVFSLFPEYSDILTNEPEKSNLTLEHLLTMTSGLDWNDTESSYYDPQNDMNLMFNSSDPIRYILSKPLIRTPGTVYDYQNCNTNVLGRIIHKITGQRIDKFAEENLFNKLGIVEREWQIMPNEAALASGELKLRPRDMTKFGLLLLNNGLWEGEQIISRDWVEVSTRRHIPLREAGRIWENGYGYHWWLNTFHSNNNFYESYFADGWGGQQIIIFSDINLVVVFTGGNYYDTLPNGEILVRYILPAIDTK